MKSTKHNFKIEGMTTSDGSAVTRDERTDVREEVDRLYNDLEIERDARLRLAAEYQNYRRRSEAEKADAAKIGKRDLLIQLLTIADDLDLAEKTLDAQTDSVADGVRMIRRRFLEVLESNGVVAFESEGQKFDPERHEAFDVVPAEDVEFDMVHHELRRGYFWNGRLLRPAMVVVAQ